MSSVLTWPRFTAASLTTWIGSGKQTTESCRSSLSFRIAVTALAVEIAFLLAAATDTLY